jgi:hypothetical protein
MRDPKTASVKANAAAVNTVASNAGFGIAERLSGNAQSPKKRISREEQA